MANIPSVTGAFDPIKSLGTHTVTAKLHNDVEFPITVEVVSK